MEDLKTKLEPFMQLLPEAHRGIEIKNNIICLLQDMVSIEETEVETVSIRGTILVPGWKISTWTHFYGYPHEPDGVEEDECYADCNPNLIVEEAVKVVFGLLVKSVAISNYDADMAEYFADEEKMINQYLEDQLDIKAAKKSIAKNDGQSLDDIADFS